MRCWLRPEPARSTRLIVVLASLLAAGAPAAARAAAPAEGRPGTARHLEEALDAILGRHVRGGLVDYAALREDAGLAGLTESLSAAEPDSLASRGERLAFWINAYNTLVLKGVADAYPIRSVSEVGWLGKWSFFKGRRYEVGGRRLTLDDIEHGILRADFQDPRIHFALVCASLGCPPMRSAAFHADRIETELEDATRRFINDPRKVRFDREAGVLRVSRIFEWYRDDFLAAVPSVAHFVGKYLEGGPPPPGTPIEHMEYSWDLNDLRAVPAGEPAAPREP